ncbi:MAG: hypothetical protein V3V99_05125 [candidate division Zixibacteria bacterium]
MSKVMIMLGVVFFIMTGLSFGETPLEKGNAILGGQFYVFSQSGDLYEDDGDGMTTIILNPSLGFFVSDGFMMGANFDLVSLSQSGDTYTEFRIGPKIGYYLNTNQERVDVKGAVYPYISGFFNFGQIDFGGNGNINITEFGAQVGMILMISDAVGADLGFRVSSDKWSWDEYSDSGTTIIFGVGITSFLY